MCARGLSPLNRYLEINALWYHILHNKTSMFVCVFTCHHKKVLSSFVALCVSLCVTVPSWYVDLSPFLAIKSELKRADYNSWEVRIPKADSLNYPLLVRSEHWSRFVYVVQLVCVIQSYQLLLLHAHATCKREWCMRFVFMHTVFSTSKLPGLCAIANTLFSYWLNHKLRISHTHTNTQILSEEHIERDLVLFQHDRKWELSNPKKYINLEPLKANKHLLKCLPTFWIPKSN